jgi:pimeloyl-ACP methyl ester carboxylesterase
MPFAENARDGVRIYFEDDGGDGTPVLLLGGIFDWVDQIREAALARALPTAEFRRIFVEPRGIARSDRPHDEASYQLPLRVADVTAVLDALEVERAHYVASSWGARLGFGVGEHAPARLRALVVGGQQPYAIDPEGPLVSVVTAGLESARSDGMEALLQAMEGFWDVRFPDWQRELWLQNDPAALRAAWHVALAEGDISRDLGVWTTPCLIYAGVADGDFFEQARRASEEIPGAEFLELPEQDHLAAHGGTDPVVEAALRLLRSVG